MLHSFFFDTATEEPDSPALWVDGHLYSYDEIGRRVRRVSGALSAIRQDAGPQRCLLFAHRSVDAYVGLLGILDAGMAYVPLSPNVPATRTAAIIEQAGATLMLVDRRCAAALEAVLPLLDACPRIFLLDGCAKGPQVACAYADALTPLPMPATASLQHESSPDDIAYILFTSGSTGTPKGVPISHANADAYVAAQSSLDGRLPGARYAQYCELTFDPSVHDMFVCWANGGCLYVPRTVEPLYNAAFIKEHAITHWNSVPSAVAFMQQFRKLPPNAFPALRVSMFGGEPLTRSTVLAWQRAAPNSRIVNLYGPTEATVACTRFEVTSEWLDDARHTVMPLGWPVPGQEVLIVDEALEPAATGETGELLIGGPQLANGYLSPQEAGNRRFFAKTYPGRSSKRWYRSADAACESTQYGVLFQGRLDTQVKIRGSRIELEEVEHVVQQTSGAALCAVVAWPLDEAGRPAGLVAFVTGSPVDVAKIQHACRERLPAYAVPHRILTIDAFPLNANGKIDRKALAGSCVREHTESQGFRRAG